MPVASLAPPPAATGLTETDRDRRIQWVLAVEACANAAVMVVKAVVGVTTGATVLLADAVHSLADLANNGLALLASRVASTPPDRGHPYGHRKFETLAVFALAALLCVLAVEVAAQSFRRADREIVAHGWGLAAMIAVLLTNVGLTTWESRWARRLDSTLLKADAQHTLSDVLTTVAAIAGWQLASAGYPWLDRAFTLLIAGLILFLAYGLFRRAIPVLVDQVAADHAEIELAIERVPGVLSLGRVRSRNDGASVRIDVVVGVDPKLTAVESHAIADAIERELYKRVGARDVCVHVEPEGK